MPKRLIEFEFDSFYHLYNRGWNKQQLFYEERDYERFLKSIQKYKEKFPAINILSYCILPNHFHFILCLKQESGLSEKHLNLSPDSISLFMLKIQQSYAMFFNTKYGLKAHHKIFKKQKAPVFEGRFQARVIEDESYLAHLQNYVEYNAVKHNLVSDPKNWAYSSFKLESKLQKKNPNTLFLSDDFNPFFE